LLAFLRNCVRGGNACWQHQWLDAIPDASLLQHLYWAASAWACTGCVAAAAIPRQQGHTKERCLACPVTHVLCTLIAAWRLRMVNLFGRLRFLGREYVPHARALACGGFVMACRASGLPIMKLAAIV
jgi:hypothetical protein